MLRLLSFIVISMVIIGLAYLASTYLTGILYTEIAGFEIAIPHSVLVLGLIILVGLFIFLDRIIRWFLDLPFISPYKRSARRQAKSFEAINKGLVAVAAGHPKEALRQAKRAEKLSDSNSLTHLLAAQAALASDDESEAIKRYTELLKDADTRLMGYRGLFSLHANKGHYEEAYHIVKRAYGLHPKSHWAFHTLFEISIKTGQFDDALKLIEPGIKKQHLSLIKGRHYKAVLYTEKARLAKLDNPQADVMDYYSQARKAEADFIPALMGLLECYMKQDQKRKARKIIEYIWQKSPRYDVLNDWLKLQEKTDAESLYKAAQKLAAINPEHEESQLLIAEYALIAEKWGDAADILVKLLKAHDIPQQRTLRLLCQLEEKDDGRQNPEIIRQYMFDMATARTLPHWVCSVSGMGAKEWQAISPAGKFDGLYWVEAGKAIVNNTLTLEDETMPNLLLEASHNLKTLETPKESPQNEVVTVEVEGDISKTTSETEDNKN